MRRLLLTVEETFFLRGRNILLLAPFLVDLNTSQPFKQPTDDLWPNIPRMPSPRPTQVELRLPDGTTRVVACRFVDAHFNWGMHNWRSDTPPGFKPPWVVLCGLPLISREAVPPGTQIWYAADTY